MDGSFFLFLAVAAAVIVTPGQDTALTIRNTLAGGRGGGIATACGVSTGQAIWAAAAIAGIVAFVAAVEPVFAALKLAGAGYLIYLGLQSLVAAFRIRTRPIPSRGHAPLRLSHRSAYVQGLVSNLSNPKMAIFFASLLPQFDLPGLPPFLAMTMYSLLFCSMTLLWLSIYATVIVKAEHVFRRPPVRRWLDGIAGMALIGLGVRIATSDHGP